MYSAEQYLHWYNLLQDPLQSRSANKNLIKLENSKQSWQIAKNLIGSGDPHVHKHGCQLLCKKLSNPYTQEDEQQHQIEAFILSVASLNKLLCYSLAKIHLHLNYQSIHLTPPHDTIKNLLTTLSSVFAAVNSIRISQQTVKDKTDSEKSRGEKLYRNYKNVLVENFQDPQYIPIIVECIDNLVTVSIRIESPQLVRCLLTQQISEVYNILQEIILQEKYPQLNQQIFQYLSNHSSAQEIEYFHPIFLAFSRSLKLTQIPISLFEQIVGKALDIMRMQLKMGQNEQANVNYINDTFLFWNKISNEIVKQKGTVSYQDDDQQEQNKQNLQSKNEVSPELRSCAVKAFVEVWNIAIQRCILYRIPKFHQDQGSLSLSTVNIDDEYQCFNVEVQGNRFRSVGEDFLIMCYTSYCKNDQYSTLLLKSIYQLVSSQNQLQLQLGIFTLSCIIEDVGTTCIHKISQIMLKIANNPNCTNPTIWQQILKLMGKFGPQQTTNPAILQQTLRIIQKSLQINQLAPLACESLNSIISACAVSSCKQQQSPLLEQFLDYIFQEVYFSIDGSQKNQIKKFELLTNSYFIFIYNFKNTSAFEGYLLQIHKRWQSFATCCRKTQVLQNLTMSHVFIGSQIAIPFTHILSQFCVEHLDQLVHCVCQCPIQMKQELQNYLFRIGLMSRTLGGYNCERWAEAILKILNIGNKNNQIIHSYITPAYKFLKVETKNQELYESTIKQFIKVSEPIVSSMMVNSQEKHYENGLLYHFQVIYKHGHRVTQFYNPDPILNFISQKIIRNQNFTEFVGLRTSLTILKHIMLKNYHPQLILQEVLSACNRLLTQYWVSIEGILITAYKMGGMAIYEQTFKNIKPSLLPPNPLFNAIDDALKSMQLKTLRKLFASCF